MKTIVAIGGGEIGRPGTSIETEKIDREIIRLSGKKNPDLLFIPTASHDSSGYIDVVRSYFGTRLGCNVDVLHVPSPNMDSKIFSSDIIYVGGGNTAYMIEIWKKTGVDVLLKKAYDAGVILSGLSAGAICWFEWGHSDSDKFENSTAAYRVVEGLGLLEGGFCPHYDVELDRQTDLERIMKHRNDSCYAVENRCALIFEDGKMRVFGGMAFQIRAKGKVKL